MQKVNNDLVKQENGDQTLECNIQIPASFTFYPKMYVWQRFVL